MILQLYDKNYFSDIMTSSRYTINTLLSASTIYGNRIPNNYKYDHL